MNNNVDPCLLYCFPCVYLWIVMEKMCICCCCCVKRNSIKSVSDFDWYNNKEILNRYNGHIYGIQRIK